jgi:predicted HAD superfamily Cof-like phosphohydrolase
MSAYECDNCKSICSRSALKEIKDFHQRVDINGIVPAGECPICGALCYEIELEEKSQHQFRVEEFMKLAGQEVPAVPTMPSAEIRKLRAKLILEEALETVKALGFRAGVYSVDNYFTRIEMERLELRTDFDPDMVEIIDGCCDLKVVTTGTLSAFGLPDEPFQTEVDRNNLAKFGPGGHRRDDGKWVKPPGHKPPDIAGILKWLEGKDEQGQSGDEAGSDGAGPADA